MLPDNDMFDAKPEDAAVLNNETLVAIKKQKVVMGLDGIQWSLLREIKLLQELDHPNIVKLHDVFHLKNLLFFALEYGPIDLSHLMFK